MPWHREGSFPIGREKVEIAARSNPYKKGRAHLEPLHRSELKPKNLLIPKHRPLGIANR
jgi:hypothetical protein